MEELPALFLHKRVLFPRRTVFTPLTHGHLAAAMENRPEKYMCTSNHNVEELPALFLHRRVLFPRRTVFTPVIHGHLVIAVVFKLEM